jgi:hypothetical protein
MSLPKDGGESLIIITDSISLLGPLRSEIGFSEVGWSVGYLTCHLCYALAIHYTRSELRQTAAK